MASGVGSMSSSSGLLKSMIQRYDQVSLTGGGVNDDNSLFSDVNGLMLWLLSREVREVICYDVCNIVQSTVHGRAPSLILVWELE